MVLVLCLCVSSFRITSWSFLASRSLRCFSSRSHLRMLATIFCLVLAGAPPYYPFLPISLNSLDLAGVRLRIPRDSQILLNSCRCRWYQCRWRNRAQVGARWRSCLLCCVFSGWSVVVPSWDDRGSSIWGCLLLFWFHSRTLIVFWMMYALFMYCVKWRL